MTRPGLLMALARYGYYHSKSEPFRLSSGELSHEYLDCRAALARPEVLTEVADIFLDSLNPRIRALGGLTMGADPIAVAASMRSWETEWRRGDDPVLDLWWFSIRKEPKGHGVEVGYSKEIVGEIWPSDLVTVVDDVVTTGASTIRAIQTCRRNQVRVVQVLALVDRQQGGLAAIQAELDRDPVEGARASAFFTMEEVRSAWRKVHPEG